MCSRSNRRGMATLTLPKKLTRPETMNVGYCPAVTGAPANQPAKSTKLIGSNVPIVGKLVKAGRITTALAGEEALLLLDANERDPPSNAEQDPSRDGIVGEGIEGVGRNKQREPMHLCGWLDEGRTEEGGGLPGRKGERHQKHRGKGQHPRAYE